MAAAVVLFGSVRCIDAAPRPPIIDAVKASDVAAVRRLLKEGADVSAADVDGTTALHVAVLNNAADVAGMLLRAGARVDARNRYGVTPLRLAAASGAGDGHAAARCRCRCEGGVGRREQHAKLMFDLQVLAFQSDTTRIFSMMMGRELSGHVFRNLGQSEQHHIITHHRNDQKMIEQKIQIDVYHMHVLTYFLDKLATTRDGESSLLDHSLIVYGSAMGDGNQHAFHDIPTLLIGKAAGRIATGRHIKRQEVPMTNLLVSVLDKAGVQIDQLGDSTGSLDLGSIVGV
jgi:hypothetical protein